MKLNWGHYVTIGFSSFVIFILFMVFKSYQQNSELVAEDYYAQEIAFQDVIDKKSNAARLIKNIEWIKTEKGLTFIYPELNAPISGEIFVFRPSDKNLDIHYKIEIDNDGKQHIDAANMKKGKYIIKIDWESEGIGFFTQGELYIIK